MENDKAIKSLEAYKTIGETAKELNLINKKTGSLQTHTIRYWETQFKQIRPSIKAGNRRYYSKEMIYMIKKIKFLLKDKGLTINGVKKLLNQNKDPLDDNTDLSINMPHNKNTKTLINKAKKITKIIEEIKLLK